ncbi:MAG: hypothetical protein JWR84_1807 [Caulobacter sp.]|nr:hypothetical protein [Caulobacter sp.]
MRLLLPVLVLAAALAGPALAADKLVPATAAGALEAHRGKPWYEPLETCAGFHIYNSRRLSAAGDGAGYEAAMTRAAEFMMPAAKRISEDQGKTFGEGLEAAKPQVQNYATALEITATGDAAFISGWTRACDEILAGYKAAVG